MKNPKLLKISGLLIALGLAVEGVTLQWAHPTAFMLFLLLGATLVAGGILAFAWFMLIS